ncbi:MAG: M56 family metallopeptidase [Planctomycetota bacterium]
MSEVLSGLLSNTVGAAFLGLLAFVSWRVSRSAPLAHGLALLALLKLVTPPLLEVPLAFGEPRASGAPAAPLLESVGAPLRLHPVLLPGQEASPGEPSKPGLGAWLAERSTELLFGLWAVGSLSMLLLVSRRARRFRWLFAAADPPPGPLGSTVRELCRQLGLRREPRVVVVNARISPSLFALTRRPTILLPAKLVRELDTSEMRAVLAHELCHLANRDHCTRWLECVVAVVHWWNPIAHGVRRLLREVEELRCDARAVALLGSRPRSYGRTILKASTYLASAPTPVPLGASGLGGARSLRRRLTMIAEHRLAHRLAWPSRLTLSFGAAFLLPLGVGAQDRTEREIDERIETQQKPSRQDLSRLLEQIEKLIERVETKLDKPTRTRRRTGRLGLPPEVDSDMRIRLVTPAGEPKVWIPRDWTGLPKKLRDLWKNTGTKGIGIPTGRIEVVLPDGEGVKVLRGIQGGQGIQILRRRDGKYVAYLAGKSHDGARIHRPRRKLDPQGKKSKGSIRVGVPDRWKLEYEVQKKTSKTSSGRRSVYVVPDSRRRVEVEVETDEPRARTYTRTQDKAGRSEVESLRKRVRKLEQQIRDLKKALRRKSY